MNTMQVLSAAYADIFGIEMSANGYYSGQRLTFGSVIEYVYFDRNSLPFDIDADYIEATTEDGSEGCWIGVFRVHYDAEMRAYHRDRVGTIKTLDDGCTAWKDMGGLAGELAYKAGKAAWKLYKAEKEVRV